LAVVCAAAVCLGGCRAGYIARVGLEHLRYVRSAVPISDAIAATADPERRARLELVLAAREFAAANGLDVSGSYAEVADTSGLATAHVVTAAYPDRLEPYTWHYPIIGTIPYRGYFEREDAEAFGAKLRDRGYDVYIVEASGYSTLGWFDDPLPSGVLEEDRVGVASFIFHELLHQTVYVPGSIDFNETLATAVSIRLTSELFAARGDDEAVAATADRRARWLAQADFCDAFALRLDDYFRSAGADREALLAGRAELYAAVEPDLKRLGLLAADEDGETIARSAVRNNAWFLALWRYRRDAGRLMRYVGRFDSVADMVADLRGRLERRDRDASPYELIAATESPSA
jgi:predicted aminopeptidase